MAYYEIGFPDSGSWKSENPIIIKADSEAEAQEIAKKFMYVEELEDDGNLVADWE